MPEVPEPGGNLAGSKLEHFGKFDVDLVFSQTSPFPQREFPQKAASLSKLRRVDFRVCNIKPSKVLKSFTDEVATEFFEALKCINLQHLTVNSMCWEVSKIYQYGPCTIDSVLLSTGEVGHGSGRWRQIHSAAQTTLSQPTFVILSFGSRIRIILLRFPVVAVAGMSIVTVDDPSMYSYNRQRLYQSEISFIT